MLSLLLGDLYWPSSELLESCIQWCVFDFGGVDIFSLSGEVLYCSSDVLPCRLCEGSDFFDVFLAAFPETFLTTTSLTSWCPLEFAVFFLDVVRPRECFILGSLVSFGS